MEKELKTHRIYFRLDSKMLKQLRELGRKLGLNRAETLRLSLDEAIAKHTHPGHRGEITAIGTQQLDNLLMSLHNRIRELSPEAQPARRAKEAEGIYQRVEKLEAEGKELEAKKLISESCKKGIMPVHFSWLDGKEKLSPRAMIKVFKDWYEKYLKGEKQ